MKKVKMFLWSTSCRAAEMLVDLVKTHASQQAFQPSVQDCWAVHNYLLLESLKHLTELDDTSSAYLLPPSSESSSLDSLRFALLSVRDIARCTAY